MTFEDTKFVPLDEHRAGTDRELMELAAKAAGVTIKYEEGCVTASLASGEFVKMMLRTPEAKADPEGAAAAAMQRLLQVQGDV